MASLLARWWLAVVLIVVGGAGGGLYGHSKEVDYTAESRLVVGSDDLSSYEVAGFALASQDLASNYARYVDNSSIVSADLEHSLKSRVSKLVSVSASPIPGSSVVSVEVIATSRSVARVGAQTIAETLVRLTKSTGNTNVPPLLAAYTKLSRSVQLAANRVGRLSKSLSLAKQANKPYASIQSRLVVAQTTAASLRLQTNVAANRYTAAVVNPPSDSALNLVQPAAIIDDNSKKTVEIYAVGGGLVGVLIALALASLLERRAGRRGRRRKAEFLNAAYGMPHEQVSAPVDAEPDRPADVPYQLPYQSAYHVPDSIPDDVPDETPEYSDAFARHFESSTDTDPAEMASSDAGGGGWADRSKRRRRRRGYDE